MLIVHQAMETMEREALLVGSSCSAGENCMAGRTMDFDSQSPRSGLAGMLASAVRVILKPTCPSTAWNERMSNIYL